MTKPFLTTVVGSMPKPAWLIEQVPLNEKGKQLHGKGANWNFTGDLLAAAMDDATRVTLHDQENAGIDIISDGQGRGKGGGTGLEGKNPVDGLQRAGVESGIWGTIWFEAALIEDEGIEILVKR